MKNVIKYVIRLSPIIILFCLLLYFHISNNVNNNRVYTEAINSIINKRSNWQVRASEFYLENGLRIDSTYLNNYDLMVGDSISKLPYSKYFEVHRKADGFYEKKYVYEFDE